MCAVQFNCVFYWELHCKQLQVMSQLRYIAEYAEFSLLIVSAGVSAKLAHVKLMLLSILSTSCLL